jgi:hypothetical protein
MTTVGQQWIGKPALVVHSDGQLEVFAVGPDQRLYRRPQAGVGGPLEPAWHPVGAGAGRALAAGATGAGIDLLAPGIAEAVEPYGPTTVFARCTAGRMIYAGRVPGSGWSDWRELGSSQRRAVLGHPVAAGQTGPVPPFLVVRSATGAIWYGTRAADGTAGWDSVRWTNLGQAPAGACAIGVTAGAGTMVRLAMFAVGPDRHIWTNYAEIDPVCPTPDEPAPAGGWSPEVVTRRPAARVAGRIVPLSGTTVVWRGMNDSTWQATMKPTGLLGDVRDLGFPLAGDPATATSSGSVWMSGRTQDGRIWVRRCRSGRSWEQVTLDQSDRVEPAADDPALAVGPDGLADVVFAGADHRLQHLRQLPRPLPARTAPSAAADRVARLAASPSTAHSSPGRRDRDHAAARAPLAAVGG